jgi:ribosomal protein L24
MRGDHKGFEGKISRIDRSTYRVYVEGLTREKVDGTAIAVAVHPSKIMITNLNLDDKWRKQVLERKKMAHKELAEVTEKPPKEIVEAKEIIEEKIVEQEKAVVEEKPKEKKARARKKKVTKKPAAERMEKKKMEAKAEEKPKAKKPRAKRKTKKETEGGT